MARPRGRPKTSTRTDRTARVDSTILGWAEMVATARGITLAEYLSETLREPVAKDFAVVMEQMKRGNAVTKRDVPPKR
jgi:hypothetical protein